MSWHPTATKLCKYQWDLIHNPKCWVDGSCRSGETEAMVLDLYGLEPIKPYVGTVKGFIEFLLSLNSGIGKSKGHTAHLAMLRMGKIKLTKKGPKPANTAPFNTADSNRYIYTKKGGWIDMAHFMFYAGRAYRYQQQK